ncbi:MAG: hypothetical protein ABR548_05385 [Actinomycetota bacterium]|nr:hypothetical protein [Actinomycetota bacterium]
MEEHSETAAQARSWAREAAIIVDPLLVEVFAFAWAEGGDVPPEVLLRMAYLQGYQDALAEPERGGLLKRLGVQVPPLIRPTKSAPRSRRPKGSSDSSGK